MVVEWLVRGFIRNLVDKRAIRSCLACLVHAVTDTVMVYVVERHTITNLEETAVNVHVCMHVCMYVYIYTYIYIYIHAHGLVASSICASVIKHALALFSPQKL